MPSAAALGLNSIGAALGFKSLSTNSAALRRSARPITPRMLRHRLLCGSSGRRVHITQALSPHPGGGASLLTPTAVAAEAVDAARIESGQCANNHQNGEGGGVGRVHSLHVRRAF